MLALFPTIASTTPRFARSCARLSSRSIYRRFLSGFLHRSSNSIAMAAPDAGARANGRALPLAEIDANRGSRLQGIELPARASATELRKEARRYRMLAEHADPPVASMLRGLADDYEEEARKLEAEGKPPSA